MEDSISTSASTIRTHPHPHGPDAECDPDPDPVSASGASSPRSSTLPSPPDSPSSGSVSSLPSVSSSFFFSSAAASPGPSHPYPHQHQYSNHYPHSHSHSHPHSHSPNPNPDHDHDPDTEHTNNGLIIPSLELPAPIARPTPFGQTLGTLRLLVLSSAGAARAFVAGLLLEGNADVVDVGTWVPHGGGGWALRASTDWREGYGAAAAGGRYEPAGNVEILDLPGYGLGTDVDEFTETLRDTIQAPFHTLAGLLDPAHRPSGALARLVAAPSTPLYTALVFLLPPAPTELDWRVMQRLGAWVPVVPLPYPPHSSPPTSSSLWGGGASLSGFRPHTALALRTGLFRAPETLAALRGEAADRFLRWREVEWAVEGIRAGRGAGDRGAGFGVGVGGRGSGRDGQGEDTRWDEERWEREWAPGLSHAVARRLREGTITQPRPLLLSQPGPGHSSPHYDSTRRSPRSKTKTVHVAHHTYAHTHAHTHPGDPLHLPSLLALSVSLLGPLRARLGRFVGAGVVGVGVGVFVGGFCVGVGVGVWVGGGVGGFGE